jgi:acetyltransferase-like isoleucine patch superfamily enzyme
MMREGVNMSEQAETVPQWVIENHGGTPDDWRKVGGGWSHRTATIGKYAQIGERATIGEVVKIGDRATIGAWATIGDRVTIVDRVTIGEQVKIGDRATIGEHATIGERAKIGEGVKIGDRATIGEHATIGERARIGEGATINRHRYLCIVGVGSSMGTLMAYPRDGHIEVTRGCFVGTLDEFAARAAVHKDEDCRESYAAIVAAIRAWASTLGLGVA